MKILVDARELHQKKAGIGRYIFNLFEDISRLECSSTFGSVIMQGAGDALPAILKKDILEIEWNGRSKFLRPLWDNYYIPQYFNKGDYELFYSTAHCAPLFHQNIPIAATIHDLTPFIFKNAFPYYIGKYLRFNLKRIGKIARMITVPSESTKSDLIKILKINESKIKVINQCLIFPNITDKVTPNFKIPEKYLLTVGTNEPRKNLAGLLKAYDRLKSEIREEYPLIITGKPGWKSENLAEIICKLNIDKNIITPGYVPEEILAYLYSHAALFCYPSLYEGFGFPPLEAMHYGAPVLTSNVSSLPEVTGDAAILVNPYDIDDITDKITMILSNKDLRNDLRIKGKIQAAKFVDNGFGRKMLELFDEAIS